MDLTLSPSQFKTWLNCEKQWEWMYKEGLKPRWGKTRHMDKGSYIHQLLHYYYNLLHQYEIGDQIVFEAVKARISEDIKLQADPDYEFMGEVIATMFRYMRERSPEIDKDLKNHEVEIHLEYEYDDTLFHGYVDLAHGGIIRDHKTGARYSYDPDTDIQLLFYAMLWWLIHGEVPYTEISFVNSSKEPKNNKWKLAGFHPTVEQVSSLWDFVRSEDERRKTLKPRSNWSACKGCPYYPLCRAERRGYSNDGIRKSNYVVIRGPNAREDSSNPKDFVVDFRRGSS